MADVETSRGVALGALNSIFKQDYERLWDEYLTEDSTWTMISAGTKTLSGRAIPEFFATGKSIFEGGAPTVEITGVTAEGDRVAVEGVGHGHFLDGGDYSNRYHFLLIVRDGRVSEVREYLDTQHMANVFAGLH